MNMAREKALEWSEVAKALGLPEGQRGIKAAKSRMFALGYKKPCGRCGGSGSYSWNAVDGTRCFGCSGSREKLMGITPSILTEALKKISEGALDAYFERQVRRKLARTLLPVKIAEVKSIRQPIFDAYEAGYKARDIPGHVKVLNLAAGDLYFSRVVDFEPDRALAFSHEDPETAVEWLDAGIEVAREIASRFNP